MGRIKNLICTCSGHPSQWEGKTEKNEAVYIRYRWGHLTINLSKSGGDIEDAVLNGKLIHSEQIGDDFDGEMSPTELQKIIKENNLFEF